jgi:hypothetical protein
VDESPVVVSLVGESTVGEPAVAESPVGEPAVAESTVGEPAVDESQVAGSPVGEPAVDESPVVASPDDEAPVAEPPVDSAAPSAEAAPPTAVESAHGDDAGVRPSEAVVSAAGAASDDVGPGHRAGIGGRLGYDQSTGRGITVGQAISRATEEVRAVAVPMAKQMRDRLLRSVRKRLK